MGARDLVADLVVRYGFQVLGAIVVVKVSDVGIADGELYQALTERFRAGRIGVPLRQHEVRLVDGATLAAG